MVSPVFSFFVYRIACSILNKLHIVRGASVKEISILRIFVTSLKVYHLKFYNASVRCELKNLSSVESVNGIEVKFLDSSVGCKCYKAASAVSAHASLISVCIEIPH